MEEAVPEASGVICVKFWTCACILAVYSDRAQSRDCGHGCVVRAHFTVRAADMAQAHVTARAADLALCGTRHLRHQAQWPDVLHDAQALAVCSLRHSGKAFDVFDAPLYVCLTWSWLHCRKANDQEQAGSKKQKPPGSAAEEQPDLQFGRVEVGQTWGGTSKHQKKKKPSKEQLLQEAVQKQQQKTGSGSDLQVCNPNHSVCIVLHVPCLPEILSFMCLCWCKGHGCV